MSDDNTKLGCKSHRGVNALCFLNVVMETVMLKLTTYIGDGIGGHWRHLPPQNYELLIGI